MAVQKALRRLGCRCDVVETDYIAGSAGITWESESNFCRLPTSEGKLIDPRQINVSWIRRINYPQLAEQTKDISTASAIVNNDCKAALLGALLTKFRGTWVDHPLFVQQAENKLLQLHLARAAGFRTPKTLVSQDPERIRRFCRAQPNGAIVKTVRGVSTFPLVTLMVSERMLEQTHSLSISPACYQEYIPGKLHIRVNCFGGDVSAVQIESAKVDWRQNLDIPFSPFTVNPTLRSRLLRVLRGLQLSMGVFDLKLNVNGDPVWLEINPQGQFLFLEGLTGLDLTTPFVKFLLRSV